jgi:hypothetical protein
VSVGSGPREAFCRLPDGSYEVFEEKAGLTSNRSLWVSGTASKVIDTLPFDVVPAEMQVTKNIVKHCKVLSRGKSSLPPSREEATTFSEYVAQQPNHVRRLLRHCDISDVLQCTTVLQICSRSSVVENLDDIDQSSSLWRYGVD